MCSDNFSIKYLEYTIPNSVNIPVCALSKPKPCSNNRINSLERPACS